MSCPNTECALHIYEVCVPIGHYAAVMQDREPNEDHEDVPIRADGKNHTPRRPTVVIFFSFKDAIGFLLEYAYIRRTRAEEEGLDIAARLREVIAELKTKNKAGKPFRIKVDDDNWWRIEHSGNAPASDTENP